MKKVKIQYNRRRIKLLNRYNKYKPKKDTNTNLFIFLRIIIIILFLLIININKSKTKKNIKQIRQNRIDNHLNEQSNIQTNVIHLNISSLNYTQFNINESIKEDKIINKNGFEYFCCYCTMGKEENIYVRELIRYYLNLGVEKFVLGDNNFPNSEKFSDILQDYINNGTVDIIDIIGKEVPQGTFYGIMYERYKTRCEWLTFFDFDEYLVMHFNEERNITLNEYLSNQMYNNCDSILVNWIIYDDNDLVYYDNRTLIERFTRPVYSFGGNKFVKTIVRGNLTKVVFQPLKTHHHPNVELKNCDTNGELIKYATDTLEPPRYKYAYLMHYSFRTVEEYVRKLIRGSPCSRPLTDPDGSVNFYFSVNKFTEEKLKVFEKGLNRTFLKFHHNQE